MIRELMMMLRICSVTVSAAALVFHIYARTLGKKARAKWLYLAWLGILAAYLILYRPAFDYREYQAVQADLITREELQDFPALAVEIVETPGPAESWNWISVLRGGDPPGGHAAHRDREGIRRKRRRLRICCFPRSTGKWRNADSPTGSRIQPVTAAFWNIRSNGSVSGWRTPSFPGIR